MNPYDKEDLKRHDLSHAQSSWNEAKLYIRLMREAPTEQEKKVFKGRAHDRMNDALGFLKLAMEA